MTMFALEAARLTSKSAKRTVVVFAENKGRLTPAAQIVDEGLDGLIRSTLRTSRYQGGAGEFTRVTVQNNPISQVIVAGLGKGADDRRDYWKSGLAIGKQLDALGVKEATLALGELDSAESAFNAACALIEGIHMALYRFEQFKEVKEHNQSRFERLVIHTSTRTARMLEEETPRLTALLNATDVTRTAVNLPPNIANPEYMADQARKLEKLGVKVEVIDEKQMKKLGMNLILAVGGNAAPEDQPRLVLMHWNGGSKGEAPQAIVGKGVMFDTGGYNIKINASMGGMKFDMAGAGAVLGTMEALARRKAPINVVGVMACAMNMIGQVSFLPDSIYKSYKGLFVEIGNTDAEGRLVLADAIAYTIEKHQPEQLVDLATLTGACMAALGGAYAGLFSTSNSLANALSKAGDEVGERLWRMPVDDFYAAPTDVADVNNNGSPYGGASTGAVFIKRFADKTPWAHLDIAGVANVEKIPGGQKELGHATGFGVRLLVNWLEAMAAAAAAPATRRGRPRGRPARASVTEQTANTPKRPRGRPRKAA
jgi:leucyl aminopeptidase